MGFSHPSRLDPNSSPTTWATSLGVLFPYSASGEESSRSQFPGICRQVPPSRLRCRSQVFETSQRLIPLPTVLPFFRQETLMGFHPSGDYSLREAPIPHRYRNTLLTFLLRVGLSPFLGGESPRACWRFPRILRQTPFFVYRVFIFAKVDRFSPTRLMYARSIRPSWAFASSWIFPQQAGSTSALRP